MCSTQPWPQWVSTCAEADRCGRSPRRRRPARRGRSCRRARAGGASWWPTPLAMMRRPVAVEPVKAIMSTIGLMVISSPTSPCPVMTLSTPGGMPASSAACGDQEGVERRPRVRLEHDGAAGGQRRRHLHDVEHEGEVERRDGADHADGLADERAPRHAVGPAGRGARLDPLERRARPGRRWSGTSRSTRRPGRSR